ncbi:hypothetical protein AV521_11550 [Streptomyces sp. IMTB 2501]|uniref:hypothetical protein n=1 Tax=Streptomyces sp. IMTB 2501 TaxID=1776340 RepID=UPI00096F844E|nr:hypothetical protein [Streptomyces sp. IMTB 2501]OLZ71558.1 hypothetical protein AV521_11550 [Streptomyces sp. IMTB 2501]
MTQSGQGEEPSAQPAREGIVLPSDGGEPLLPGMSGAPAPAAPAGGQAWGGSWGPDQQPPEAGQGWPPAAAQQWHTPDAPSRPPSAANPGPLPPEGAPAAPSYGPAPSYDQPGGQSAVQGGGYGAGQQPGYGAGPDPYQQHHQSHQHPGSAAPLPPALPEAYPAAGAPLPPAADGVAPYVPAVPAVPAAPADEGATQYIPPIPAASADGATQYIPPVPAAPAAAEGATQYIPPVASGALPPESAGEETRYLGQAPQQQAPAPASSDAEATQYIPPYAAQAQAQGGDRQPPAEFDNLFRGGPAGGDGPAGATQQMPRVPQPDAYPGAAQPTYGRQQQPAYGAPQPKYEPTYDDDPPRGKSRVPLIAAVGVGIVVVGVGAGVLLSDGGGNDQGNDNKTVAATSPVPGSSSQGADAARAQAVELDKLLSDSGGSRASVIKAVADVKQCANLDGAASDLRAAAKQRGELVTRLGQLSVDKLPNNGDLTDALTKAWQASAAADNHYAAWADQAKGHDKVCRKGHARSTNEAQAGNQESGIASAQKVKAAALWNAIARKYGLTERQPVQL